MKPRKMTLKYWNSLSRESKIRALHHVFPEQKWTVEMLADEEPNPKHSGLWKIVWCSVKIPEKESYCKTVVNRTYLP